MDHPRIFLTDEAAFDRTARQVVVLHREVHELREQVKSLGSKVALLEANKAAPTIQREALAAVPIIPKPEPARDPQTPQQYGLAACPESLMRRLGLGNIAQFSITLDPEKRFRSFTTSFISSIFGGNARFGRVKSSSRAVDTGCSHFLYLRHIHQPYIPENPGDPGVLISATGREETWPEYEKVLVTATPGEQGLEGPWLYLGEYELFSGRPLTVAELALLPGKVIKHWASYVQRARRFEELHTRIWLRKTFGKEPSPEDVKSYAPYVKDLTNNDFITALRSGEEHLYAFGMRCAFYEGSFQYLLANTKDRSSDDSVSPSPARTSSQFSVIEDDGSVMDSDDEGSIYTL